jgi:hypothetical protein
VRETKKDQDQPVEIARIRCGKTGNNRQGNRRRQADQILLQSSAGTQRQAYRDKSKDMYHLCSLKVGGCVVVWPPRSIDRGERLGQ